MCMCFVLQPLKRNVSEHQRNQSLKITTTTTTTRTCWKSIKASSILRIVKNPWWVYISKTLSIYIKANTYI